MNRREVLTASVGATVAAALPSAADAATEIKKPPSGTYHWVIDVCPDTKTISATFEHSEENEVLKQHLAHDGFKIENDVVPYQVKMADGRDLCCAFPTIQRISFSVLPAEGDIEDSILKAADAIRKYGVQS